MDDLNTTTNQTPQPGMPDEFPKPTPPEPVPTVPSAPPTSEPNVPPEPILPTIPTPTITTEEPSSPPPPPSVSGKPPTKKVSSAIKIGGALAILLMAATLPATIILVQNRTTIAPKAEEMTTTPTPIVKPIRAAKTFIALTKGDQQSGQADTIKPREVEIKTVSSGSVKITFTTQGAYPSLIRYSPDKDWNFLTMLQEGDIGDEWQGRYHSENQVNVEPVGGAVAKTQHEFILNNLVAGQKYYFVIEIEKTTENIVYQFGLEQPEGYYTFVAE
jgi:hypothetical protein